MLRSLPSRVPVELLDHIFRDAPGNDLRQIQLCNSVFFHVASRILYRKIKELKSIKSILLLKTLSQNDKYSHFVRSLDLSWIHSFPISNTYCLLQRALNRLYNLKELILDDTRIPTSILPEESIFSLERFTCSIVCDGALSRFLVSQPALKELCLRGVPSITDPFMLPSTALPQLTHFRSVHLGPFLLAEIVAGRSIESVSAAMVMSQAGRFIHALNRSAVPIRRLSIMFVDSPVLCEVLPALASHLPQLEAMHIVVLSGQCTIVSISHS